MLASSPTHRFCMRNGSEVGVGRGPWGASLEVGCLLHICIGLFPLPSPTVGQGRDLDRNIMFRPNHHHYCQFRTGLNQKAKSHWKILKVYNYFTVETFKWLPPSCSNKPSKREVSLISDKECFQTLRPMLQV